MKLEITFGINLIISSILLIDSYPDKRFVLSSNNQRNFCFPPISYCHLQCSNGFKHNPNGCPICQCAMTSQGTGSSSLSGAYSQPLNQNYIPYMAQGYHGFSKPCLPQQMFCSLNCKYGYLTGQNGCNFCFCSSGPQGTVAPTTTTSGPIVILNNPCIASQRQCSLSCSYGYLKGPSNCNYCVCAPAGLVIKPAGNNYTVTTQTTSTTTHILSTKSPHANVSLPNPCIPSQPTCAMSCSNGFVQGPLNCQYCLCAPDPTSGTTIKAPVTTRPKPALSHDSHGSKNITSLPVTSTISPDVSNECIIATTICQLKCKGGFMTDPQRCTFCVCKDDMYNQTGIQKSEEPRIQLLNPCVEGIDICRIFCMEGYLRGPNKCQYCACRY